MALLVSFFQNARSRIKLTNTTLQLPTSLSFAEFGANALPMKRDVSHEGLHPRVPVSMVRDVSGGSRKSGSIADGTRFRVDMLWWERSVVQIYDWLSGRMVEIREEKEACTNNSTITLRNRTA